MQGLNDFKEKRRYPRYSISLPLEYGRADDAYRGGLVVNISETGLLIHAIQDLSVDEKLSVRVFFPNEYELDAFRVVGRIVWKDCHYESDWRGYKYGLSFIQIGEEDRRKLLRLLSNQLTLENGSPVLETSPHHSASEGRILSSSLDPNLIRKKERAGMCLWERFKMKLLHSR